MKNDTKVKCDVDNCVNNDNFVCLLKTLNISCTGSGSNCHNKKETICNNFSCK